MDQGAQIDVDPTTVGLDPAGLAHADALLDRYVDQGRLPGYQLVVARDGTIAHSRSFGMRDVEAGEPVTPNTLWRIYSMTKPIVSLALMRLYERGAFQLTDPVLKYLPEFTDQRVYVNGSDAAMVTIPTPEPVRIWHLLTHTSGMTYGFHRNHPIDALLRGKGYEWAWPEGTDLKGAVEFWASLPLLFTPGTEYNYSLSTDVVGRLIEVLTGQPLDEAIHDLVTGPLHLHDTRFRLSEVADPHRLGPLYAATPGGAFMAHRQLGDLIQAPSMLSGGGGLISTAADYHRFTQLLLGGGELDGVRLIGQRTLALMTSNHLPGNADIQSFGRPNFSEIPQQGVGFGLGFAVVIDPVSAKMPTSVGEYNWGGAASTAFWVDPAERLSVVFMTSLMPSSTYPIRAQLRAILYGALR